VVIDTNVPIFANYGVAPDKIEDKRLDLDCVEKCVERIERAISGEGENGVVIDEGWEILGEYGNKLDPQGQGLGDRFYKWLLNNQHNTSVVTRNPITENAERGYEEFPDHPDLIDFDRSDRKFVAVAFAHRDPKKPNILQAADGKWCHWAPALKERGVEVEFLCPKYAKALCEQKMGRK
jgi:hypothetical protein